MLNPNPVLISAIFPPSAADPVANIPTTDIDMMPITFQITAFTMERFCVSILLSRASVFTEVLPAKNALQNSVSD